MATTTMYDLTREYYRVPVTLTVAGVAINPTTFTVEFAILLPDARPTTSSWVPGTWETVGNTYRAAILVGDSGATVQITAGQLYNVWLRLTDFPERPVRMVGQIQAQ